jgi:DDE_Tnp_1-associated
VEAFAACFEDLEDPRTGNAGLHDLPEILLIALCTVLSGAQWRSTSLERRRRVKIKLVD